MKFLLGTIVPQQDQAVFAAHPANLPFLQELGFGVKKVLSFYGKRQPLSLYDSLLYFCLRDV